MSRDTLGPSGWLPPDPYWDACKLADALPEAGYGYLYLVEFSTGVIKAGKTVVPRRRIRDHIHGAAPYGVDVVNVWLSPELMQADVIEQLLLAALRGRWFCPAGDEYFRGSTFIEAVEVARQITENPSI